jgi:peptide/nickel transport system substrate-binding protein
MKTLLRWRLPLLTAALLIMLAVGMFGAAAQEERVLVIGHVESTDSLDPARGFTQTTNIINRVTYDTLVTFPAEDASAILPKLATEWEVSDDGTVYTFTLRDDVTFVSGNQMTADDVVFSIRRLQNVNGNPSFLADGIADVEAIDDLTVQFTLYEAGPSFLAELANYAFSVTDSQTIIANGGTDAEDAAETDAAENFLNSQSAGTGAYILDSWEREVQTVLVRNPDSWEDAEPYFDRIIITNIPEPATQKIALESGAIDLALDLTADQIVDLVDNPDISIYRGPANIVHFLLMNADPDVGGIVSDPTVQLAIRLALDYEGYKTLWGGTTPAANLAYGILGSLSEEHALSRDLDRARELLAEAGYPDGFDITLEYPDFSFQGVNMNTNAQKIQADLAEVGINVTLSPGELQVSLEAYRTAQQGFGYWFWGPDVLDPVDFLSFLPGGKVAFERTNWFFEDQPEEIQALIERARVEADTEARVEIFGELQRFNQQSGAYAPFIQPDIQTAFRADIEGYIWHPAWLLDVSLLSRSE